MNTFRCVCSLVALLLTLPAQAQETLLRELQSPNESGEGAFGRAVAGVPDTDGDGHDDFLVGETVYGQGSGRAYLYSGADGSLRFELTPPSVEVEDFGVFVAGAPDTDGDGRGDVLVGARGRAYLFSGADGSFLQVFASPTGNERGFGSSVAGVPDTDGDGRGDVLVSAYGGYYGSSPFGAGRAFLFSGMTGELLLELASINESENGNFGRAVAGVPDTDGDGRGDLLIGAQFEDGAGGLENVGRAYLFSGATGALLAELISPNAQERGLFGFAVDGVPDSNGDGRSDLLVGALSEIPDGSDARTGQAYLFSGADGTLLAELTSPGAAEYGNFGISVDGVPDVDGDGRGDLFIGASEEADFGGVPDKAGRAYLFSGAGGNLLGVLTSPNEEDGGRFGLSVAGISTPDGGDFLVGSIESPGSSPSRTGRAYLFDAVPPVPAVAVSLVPTETASLTEGFAFTAILTNPTEEVQTAEVWTEIVPNGGRPSVGPVVGPVTVTLAPGQRVERTLEQEGVDELAAGPYTYRAFAGSFPNAPTDSDRVEAFAVTVAGERFYPLENGDTWTYAFHEGFCIPAHWECYPTFEGFSRRTVVADTLIAGEPWSVLTSERLSEEAEVLGTGRCIARVAGDGRVQGRTIQGTCDSLERETKTRGGVWNLRLPHREDGMPAIIEVGTTNPAEYEVDALRFFSIQTDREPVFIQAAADIGVVSYNVGVTYSGTTSRFRSGALSYARVGGVIYSGEHVLGEGRVMAEVDFAFSAAYPNPFRSATTLGFSTSKVSHVRLTVYDMLGREVAVLLDGEQEAGSHTVRFDGAGLPSGVYLVRLEAGGHVQTQRLTLVR